jgi:hypothetical protein
MIKDWILNQIIKFDFINEYFARGLQEMQTKTRIEVFGHAEKDILETFEGDVEKRAEELAKEKLANLLSNVDLNKIVTVDKPRGIVYVGGKRLEEGKLASLKAEAEYFMQSELWALLSETPRELAQKAMFVEGDNLATLQKGRSILYTLSAQQNILDMFRSYSPKK